MELSFRTCVSYRSKSQTRPSSTVTWATVYHACSVRQVNCLLLGRCGTLFRPPGYTLFVTRTLGLLTYIVSALA